MMADDPVEKDSSKTERELYRSRTGNSLRAAIAVELAGLDVRRQELNFSDGEHGQDWFLKINPAGMVPVLVERNCDETLIQSGAVMDFPVSRHCPNLWPKSFSGRVLCMASCVAALGDVAVRNAAARCLAHAADAYRLVLDRLVKSILDAIPSVRIQPFLFGQSRTIADYADLPVFHMRAPLLAAIPEFRHVLDWLERMKQDPAVDRAIAYAGLQLQA